MEQIKSIEIDLHMYGQRHQKRTDIFSIIDGDTTRCLQGQGEVKPHTICRN